MMLNTKRRPFIATALLLTSLGVTTSCIDNSYDLNKDIDMTVNVGGEHLAIPVGYTEQITLDKIIELDEGDDLQLVNGEYHLLTCGYNDAVTEGKIKDIPYMLGSTADDIGVFPEMKEKGEHGGIYKGCINWSLALEKLGRKPAYVYYFTRALLGDDAGAFHSSELWYMFGTLGRSWRPKTEGDYALSKEMMDDWTNFMKTGNPNTEGKDDWKPCTKDDTYVQVLDVRK